MAVLGAVCFAGAATLHHRAIGDSFAHDAPTERRVLNASRLWLLLNTRGWLVGTGLVGFGAGLHVIALLLAPISIVQPVGVLAVPLAVLFVSRLSQRPPTKRVWGFVTMTVSGIAVFVVLAATHDSHTDQLDDHLTLGAAGLLTVVTAGCVLLAVRGPRSSHCLAWAAAAATAFGLGSALLRALVLAWHHGAALSWLGVIAAWMLIGWAAGAWFQQQAYAAGPPEVVLGALNVIDPLVAVLFGVLVLGEGNLLTPLVVLVMTGLGVIAAAGVILLARYHPDVPLRPTTALAVNS